MTDCHPHRLIHYLSPLSSSSINTCSTPAVVFNDISINSGLAAGEFRPVLHINSKSLVVTTQASYCSPAFIVTFGKVATYSIIPASAVGFVVEGDKVVRLEGATNAYVLVIGYTIVLVIIVVLFR